MWRELAFAVLAVAALDAVVAGLYFWTTGLSPWPVLIIGEALGSLSGLAFTLVIFPPTRR
jgi:hypothetical protein